MKYLEMGGLRAMGESHPSRGAWIEILTSSRAGHPFVSHPSRGAWIEISRAEPPTECTRRTPHGVRGLKSVVRSHDVRPAVVAPLTGCVD